MNRFEQRLCKRLQNKDIAAGYREMAAEIKRVAKIQRQTKEAEKTIKAPTKLPPAP